MKTRTIIIYLFSELSDKAKKKALEKLSDINVEFSWWEDEYEDAREIGLTITEFDISRSNYCRGKFISGAENCANKIIENHGATCETYKTAEVYLRDKARIIETLIPEDTDELENNVSEIDEQLNKLESEFLMMLCGDYLIMLRNDYEYKTSEAAIIETIEANEYEFTEDGGLA